MFIQKGGIFMVIVGEVARDQVLVATPQGVFVSSAKDLKDYLAWNDIDTICVVNMLEGFTECNSRTLFRADGSLSKFCGEVPRGIHLFKTSESQSVVINNTNLGSAVKIFFTYEGRGTRLSGSALYLPNCDFVTSVSSKELDSMTKYLFSSSFVFFIGKERFGWEPAFLINGQIGFVSYSFGFRALHLIRELQKRGFLDIKVARKSTGALDTIGNAQRDIITANTGSFSRAWKNCLGDIVGDRPYSTSLVITRSPDGSKIKVSIYESSRKNCLEHTVVIG